MSKRKTNINPNSTFITTKIQEKRTSIIYRYRSSFMFVKKKDLKKLEKTDILNYLSIQFLQHIPKNIVLDDSLKIL